MGEEGRKEGRKEMKRMWGERDRERGVYLFWEKGEWVPRQWEMPTDKNATWRKDEPVVSLGRLFMESAVYIKRHPCLPPSSPPKYLFSLSCLRERERERHTHTHTHWNVMGFAAIRLQTSFKFNLMTDRLSEWREAIITSTLKFLIKAF